jgi:hypothetical protein
LRLKPPLLWRSPISGWDNDPEFSWMYNSPDNIGQ